MAEFRMADDSDSSLLSRFAQARDEAAFAELVRRRLDAVYASALRRVGGDAHLARDVAQQVFVACARDAHRLAEHAVLSGWFHTTTRNVAANIVRAERRRKGREREAQAMQNTLATGTTEADWADVAPVLDAAIDELAAPDRVAVLLRFIDGCSFSEIGRALGVTEDAARKRVERAVEKLRAALGRCGVSSSATALSATLLAHPISAAPTGLAASITSGAIAGAATSAGALSVLTLMSMTKVQLGCAALLCVGLASWSWSERRENARLRGQLATTRAALAAGPASAIPTATRTAAAPNPNAAPATAKLSLTEIEARLTEIIHNWSWEKDGDSLSPLVASVDASDLRAVLTFVEQTASGDARRKLRFMFLERFARLDPAAAAAWTATLPSGADAQGAKALVATFWADTDPEAALRFAGPIRSVAQRLAARSPANAASAVLQLPAGTDRRWAVSAVAEIWIDHDPRAAAHWVDTLTDTEDRIAALSGMMRVLTDAEPQALAAYIERLPATEHAFDLGRDFAGYWANTDAAAAAKWTQSLPPNSPMRSPALRVVAEVWSRENPPAAADWIARLPADAGREGAIETFVDQVAPHAPDQAAAFAASFPEGNERHFAVARVARRWLETDPAGARKWIAELPFSPAQKERLLGGRPPGAP